MRLARSLGPLLLCIGLIGNAGAQQEKNKARESYRRASQHYKLAEYREALEAFKEAYRHYEDPSFLFNIGQCHRMLNEKSEAVRIYRTYLAEVPNAPNRGSVWTMIRSLESAIKQDQQIKAVPPQEAMPPVEPSPQPAVTVTQTAPPAQPTPVYKRWWLWTIVGGVAAVGLGVGLGVGLTQSAHAPSPNPSDGMAFRF